MLDAGNSIIKANIAQREGGEVAFPHAIHQLTENEYQKILAMVDAVEEFGRYPIKST